MDSYQHRIIGFWRGWSIAVGCAIGSGIFMMPTVLAPYGMLGFFGWFIAGLGSIFVALTMAKLVIRMPKTGGPYVYVNEALGNFCGFIIAWTYWVACVSAIAGISIAFTGYLGFLIPAISNSPIYSLLASLFLVWAVVILNIKSIENSSKFQLISTLLKLLPLLLIIFLGASNFTVSNLPELNPTELHPIALLGTVTTLVMWSFIGIETATVPADNVINPQQTIPKVLIASVLTILTLYILVSFAIAVIVPANELIDSNAPFALAASKVLGTSGGTLITIGALVSTLGSLNANTLTAGNLSLAAARDGLLPKKFISLTKSGTPIYTYLLTGIFVSILLLLNYTKGIINAFVFMAMLSTLSTLIAYAFCGIAEFRFTRADKKSQQKKYAVLVSFGTFLYAIFAIWGAGIEMIIYSIILILIGTPLYIFKR